MAISVNLQLTNEEKELLAGILNSSVDDLEHTLGGYATVALEEYCRMILGQKVFRRVQDTKDPFSIYQNCQHGTATCAADRAWKDGGAGCVWRKSLSFKGWRIRVSRDRRSWDAYNEAHDLPRHVEAYRRRFGRYPKAVQADAIYQTRETRRYCKERGIRLDGLPLGARRNIRHPLSGTKCAMMSVLAYR